MAADAERAARSLPAEAQALTSLVEALAAAGQPEQAARVAADAERAARSLPAEAQAQALTSLVEALAAARPAGAGGAGGG